MSSGVVGSLIAAEQQGWASGVRFAQAGLAEELASGRRMTRKRLECLVRLWDERARQAEGGVRS